MESLRQLPTTESRLSAWCKGVIESVWLAAVGVLPLLLNPRATLAAHEAPKLAFLKMLALLGLAAWSVLLIERRVTGRGRATPGSLARNKWVMVVLSLLAASVALSTWLSIDPMTSFWGSPEINQGALTWAAELLMLVLVGAHLRTREQILRLVTMVLLSSFAVSLIGISQWLGWDPMRPDARGGRIFSTMGNPIYLAEYLMMIFPLTIWRIIGLVEQGKTKTRARWLTLYSAILLTQAAAFACTGSRGPMIAVLVSFFTFALLYALLKNWKTLHRSLAVAAVCMALVAAGAGTWLKQQQAASRTQKFAFMGERGDSGRGEYWRKASEMLFLKHLETPPALIGDSWKPLRVWIGYGPETLTATLPFYHANADTLVLESWFHNLVWDYWHSFGLLGLGVFLTFFGLVFFLAYKRMGFIDSRSAAITFWAMPVVLALGGAVVLPLLVNNAGFAGMGAVLGFIAGLILFLTLFGKASMVRQSDAEQGDGVLIAALLAGLVGYLADQAFVFPTACSSVLFWIYAGIIIVVCGGSKVTSACEVEIPEGRKNAPALKLPSTIEGDFPLPVAVALVSSGVITLLHICINSFGSIPHRFSMGELLSTALCNTSAAKGPTSLMILPVALYWMSASLALATTVSVKGVKNEFSLRLGSILGLSGTVGFLFALLETFMITQAVPLPEMRILSAAAFDRVHDQELLFFGHIGIIVSLVILTGCKLAQQAQKQIIGSRLCWTAFGMVFASAIMLMWFVVLVPERASMFLEEGLSMQASGRGSLSSGLFKHALSLNPRPFVYRSMLSESLITDSEAESDSSRAFQLLAEAESVLKDSRPSRPINRKAYYLGRVYLHWALREVGTNRAELARKASDSFDQACAFEPHTEPVWSESGMVDLLLHGDAAAAKPKFERASQLASQSFIAWAEFHSGCSLRSRDASMKQQYALIADEYFDGAIRDSKLAKEFTSRARLSKGLLQLMTNQTDAAIANLSEAVKLGVEYDQWEIEMLLTEAFIVKADRTAARRHLERSVAMAPTDKRHMLRSLQVELGVQ
jgi:hypothetical protein